MRRVIPPEKRFFAKVVQMGECWQWIGATMPNGYGRFGGPRNEKVTLTHRWAYQYMIGEIPAGLDLDHLCRNRACVNPYHLEPVTRSVNIQRGEKGRYNSAKTHCPQGHAYSAENTRADRPGKRSCKTCQRDGDRERKRRNRLAAKVTR